MITDDKSSTYAVSGFGERLRGGSSVPVFRERLIFRWNLLDDALVDSLGWYVDLRLDLGQGFVALRVDVDALVHPRHQFPVLVHWNTNKSWRILEERHNITFLADRP
jgi:hypothetical protein